MSLHRGFAEAPRPVVLLLGWLGSREQHFSKYARLYQDLGAQVIAHQPSILETAFPDMADRALLRFMRDATYRYSSLCTMLGDTPPVLVHSMSNAGFIAYGTMLHLVSLLRAQARPPPQPLTPAEGGGGGLEFDPAAWRAAGGGARLTASRQPEPAARSFGLWGDRRPWRAGNGGGGGGREDRVHPFVRDPPSLAVLSAFRQVLKNTQGIVIDSAPSQANVHIWSRGLLSAALAEPAAGIEESHPLLLRLSRRLTERYLAVPAVAQRLREARLVFQGSGTMRFRAQMWLVGPLAVLAELVQAASRRLCRFGRGWHAIPRLLAYSRTLVCAPYLGSVCLLPFILPYES